MKQHKCKCENDYIYENCEKEVSKSFKQHITKEQWNELDNKQKLVFVGKSKHAKTLVILDEMPSIGQMIEFLGDDLEDMELDPNSKMWCVFIKYTKGVKQTEYEAKELADALWEATKQKLK